MNISNVSFGACSRSQAKFGNANPTLQQITTQVKNLLLQNRFTEPAQRMVSGEVIQEILIPAANQSEVKAMQDLLVNQLGAQSVNDGSNLLSYKGKTIRVFVDTLSHTF